MPKNTFFNIKNEKRKKIINVAIDEFASKNYHNANITTIIKNSNISSGSFYQYFKDKKDLYMYIINLGVQRKKDYITKRMKEKNFSNKSIFEELKYYYTIGFEFANKNPKLLKISMNLASNTKLLNEIHANYKDEKDSYFKKLIEKGIKKNKIRSNINLKMILKFLDSIMKSLTQEVYNKEKSVFENKSVYMDMIEETIDFIENGIKNK